MVLQDLPDAMAVRTGRQTERTETMWTLYREDSARTALGTNDNIWPLIDMAFSDSREHGIATHGCTTIRREGEGMEIRTPDGGAAYTFEWCEGVRS